MVMKQLREHLTVVPPGEEETLLRLFLSSQGPFTEAEQAVPGALAACLKLNLGWVPSGLLTEGDEVLSHLLWRMFSSATSANKPRVVAKLQWL